MPGGGVESRRYVLKKDNMGYSMHLTMIAKDSSMYIHYKNHQESVICVGGSLELEVKVGGNYWTNCYGLGWLSCAF